MYRKPKFLEVLHAIREEMSREADYDMELFAEMLRTGNRPPHGVRRVIGDSEKRASRTEDSQSASSSNIPYVKQEKRKVRN